MPTKPYFCLYCRSIYKMANLHFIMLDGSGLLLECIVLLLTSCIESTSSSLHPCACHLSGAWKSLSSIFLCLPHLFTRDWGSKVSSPIQWGWWHTDKTRWLTEHQFNYNMLFLQPSECILEQGPIFSNKSNHYRLILPHRCWTSYHSERLMSPLWSCIFHNAQGLEASIL